MKLTNNFKLEEFTRSNKAKEKGIKNVPNQTQINNLKILCENLLQPLRDIYQEPFIITSGFRNPELNKAVGGVSTSQHMTGQAADVKVKDPRKLLSALRQSGLNFDQAILYNTFLHLSYDEKRNRKQVLYAKGVKP